MEAEGPLLGNANDLIRIEGERDGSWKYYCQGFFYYKHARPNATQHDEFRCILRNCSGSIRKNAITGIITHFNAHNIHDADVLSLDVARLKNILKQQASNATSSRSLRQIFDETCRR